MSFSFNFCIPMYVEPTLETRDLLNLTLEIPGPAARILAHLPKFLAGAEFLNKWSVTLT